MAATQTVMLDVEQTRFEFRICAKPTDLGNVVVKQLWMMLPGLYEPRSRSGGNAIALVRCFWALCRRAHARGEPEHPHDRQTFLLARLLPFTLTDLAAKIVPDRVFGPKTWALQRNAIAELDGLLSRPADDVPDLVQFRDLTCDLLDMPELNGAAAELYDQCCEILFKDAAPLMDADPERAVSMVRRRWTQLKNRWYPARRWRCPEAKLALSAISYEARAALNECYSDTWEALLAADGPLHPEFGLTATDVCFLRLWHVIQKAPAEHDDRRFDLLHGTALALHPAMALLIRSTAGQVALEQFVAVAAARAKDDEGGGLLHWAHNTPEFRRLLHAAAIATYVYMEARNEQAARSRRRMRKLPTDARGGVAYRQRPSAQEFSSDVD